MCQGHCQTLAFNLNPNPNPFSKPNPNPNPDISTTNKAVCVQELLAVTDVFLEKRIISLKQRSKYKRDYQISVTMLSFCRSCWR